MIWVVEQAQDAADVPHFCYFDPTVGLDFVWDGFALEIDVNRDGEAYGKIPLPVGYLSTARNPGRWLAQFQVLCNLYVKETAHDQSSDSPVAPGGGSGDRVGRVEEEFTTPER